jgi:hypothetical protein
MEPVSTLPFALSAASSSGAASSESRGSDGADRLVMDAISSSLRRDDPSPSLSDRVEQMAMEADAIDWFQVEASRHRAQANLALVKGVAIGALGGLAALGLITFARRALA